MIPVLRIIRVCGKPLCSEPTSEAQRNKRPYSLPELTQIIQRRAGIDLQYEELIL
ncbi:hypothetical protein ASZ90_011631 [hydrocarbon metagenome]|uniref:Uncharacterized protein n=1 Tax=hydrocarbon metagenome TaxID=938273 RepID=A0A0W8FCV4_9ZZZZ